MKTNATMNLTNQLLIAMPGVADERFGGAVILVCEHSETGSLGLVLNKPMDLSLAQLLSKLEMLDEDPEHSHLGDQYVFLGGPVHPERGFVLHPPNSEFTSTLAVGERLALTTSRDVLQAVAQGHGPEHYIVALGYSGWGVGQLEQEIAENVWLTVEADPTIIFNTPVEQRFNAALALLGVDPVMLASDAGHA